MPSTQLEAQPELEAEDGHVSSKHEVQLKGSEPRSAEANGSAAQNGNGVKSNGVSHVEEGAQEPAAVARGAEEPEGPSINGTHAHTNGHAHENGHAAQREGDVAENGACSDDEEKRSSLHQPAASQASASAAGQGSEADTDNQRSESRNGKHEDSTDLARTNGHTTGTVAEGHVGTEAAEGQGGSATEHIAASNKVAEGEAEVDEVAPEPARTENGVSTEGAPDASQGSVTDTSSTSPQESAEALSAHSKATDQSVNAEPNPSADVSAAASSEGGEGGISGQGRLEDEDRGTEEEKSAQTKNDQDCKVAERSAQEDTTEAARADLTSCEGEAHGTAEAHVEERPVSQKKVPTEEDMAQQQRLIEDLVAAAMSSEKPNESEVVDASKPSPHPLPQVGGVGVPPKKLQQVIAKHGGFDVVNLNKLWAAVARELGIDTRKCTSAAYCLKRIYYQYVLNKPMPTSTKSNSNSEKDADSEQSKKRQAKDPGDDATDADTKMATDVLFMLSQHSEEPAEEEAPAAPAIKAKASKKESSPSDDEESKPEAKKQTRAKQEQDSGSSDEEDDGDEDGDKKDSRRDKGDDTPTKEATKRRNKRQVMEQLSSDRQLSREERKFQAILRQIEMAERKEKEARGEYVEPEKPVEEPVPSAQKKRREVSDPTPEADAVPPREKKRVKSETTPEVSKADTATSEAAEQASKTAVPSMAANSSAAAEVKANEDSPAPSATSSKGKKSAAKPPLKPKEKLVPPGPTEVHASGGLAAMKRHKAFFTGSERTACLPKKVHVNGVNGTNGMNGMNGVKTPAEGFSPAASASGTPTSSAPGTPRCGFPDPAKTKFPGGKKAYIFAAVTEEYGLKNICEFESNGFFDELNILKPTEEGQKLNPNRRVANPAKHTLKRRFLNQWIMEQNGCTPPPKARPADCAESKPVVKKEELIVKKEELVEESPASKTAAAAVDESAAVESADKVKLEETLETAEDNANNIQEEINGKEEIKTEQVEAPVKKEEDPAAVATSDEQTATGEAGVAASLDNLPRIPKRSADPLSAIKIPKRTQLTSQENSGQNSPVAISSGMEAPASPAITFKSGFVRDGSGTGAYNPTNSDEPDRFALGSQYGSRDGTPGMQGHSQGAKPWDAAPTAAQPRRQSAWDQPPPQHPTPTAFPKDIGFHTTAQLSPAVEREFERASAIRNLPDMRDMRRVEPSPPGMRRRVSPPPQRDMFGRDVREPRGEAGLSRESLRREREEVMRERDRDRDRDRFGPFPGGMDSPRGRMPERSPPRSGWDIGAPRSRSPRAMERSLGRDPVIPADGGPPRDRSLSPRSKELQREMQAARERRASKDPMEPCEPGFLAGGPGVGPGGNGWWQGGPPSRGPGMPPGPGLGLGPGPGPGPMRRDRPSMFDQRRPRPYSSPPRSR